MANTTDPDRRNGTTLEEVAVHAGVSRATVSRVVNESPRVSPDVRRQVEAAILELGYVPNRAARSLVTRRSGSIAVVIGEPTPRLFNDPFFPRLLRGVSAALAARDLQLVLLMPATPDEASRTGDYLAAGHVDGALMVSLHASRSATRPAGRRRRADGVGRSPAPGQERDLCRRRQPGRRPDRGRAPHRRRSEGHRDDRRSPGHDRGHRPARRLSRRARPARTATATRDSKLSVTSPRRVATRAMERLLKARPDIDAVFAASDLMAAGALLALAAAGRRVPEDVAIVGFDDSPIATTVRPNLTSVRQPIEEMGHEMARLLIDAVGGRDSVVRRVILDTELIRRASSAGRAMP